MAKRPFELLNRILAELDGVASLDDVVEQAVAIRPRENKDDEGRAYYDKGIRANEDIYVFEDKDEEYVANIEYLLRAFREKDEGEVTQVLRVKPDTKFLYGVPQLPITDDTAYYVPTEFRGYIPQKDEFRVFSEMVALEMNVLIEGPTGTGKTMFCGDWCFLRRQGMILVSVTDFDAKTFIGEFILNENRQMVWKDGPLITSMRGPILLVIDEINMGENQMLAALNHALLYREYFVAETNELVRAHPDWRVVATMNPHEGYLGTKELNPAIKRRFRLHLLLDNPGPELERQIIITQSGYDNDEFLTHAINVAKTLRHDASEGVEIIQSPCSPDHLVTWAKLCKGGRDTWRAFELAVSGPAAPEDREHFKDVMERFFGVGKDSEDWSELESSLITPDEFHKRMNDIKKRE